MVKFLYSFLFCKTNAKLWFRVDQEIIFWQTGVRHIVVGRG